MNEHGFSHEQWSAAKSEITEVLSARAKLRGMIPYSELVAALKSIRLEPRDQRLFQLLGEVSSEEDAAGRGMLSVIVVHKSGDMQPGPGFYGNRARHRVCLEGAERFHRVDGGDD